MDPVRHRLAVTTSGAASPALEQQAQAAAARWRLPFVHRRRKEALGDLLTHHAEALLVCERERVTLADAQGSIHFHPGLAHLRIRSLDAGDPLDTFGRITELKEGERVLDCTLGLAQDALVAARLVGPTGKVVGLEKSLPLFVMVSEGMAHHDPGPRSARVEVLLADAGEFLRRQEAGAFDLVYFDPMFEKPRAAQPSFELLRRHADYSPLTPEVLAEAKRVARRLVVVKGSRYSQDLRKLGLTPITLSRTADIAWGKL